MRMIFASFHISQVPIHTWCHVWKLHVRPPVFHKFHIIYGTIHGTMYGTTSRYNNHIWHQVSHVWHHITHICTPYMTFFLQGLPSLSWVERRRGPQPKHRIRLDGILLEKSQPVTGAVQWSNTRLSSAFLELINRQDQSRLKRIYCKFLYWTGIEKNNVGTCSLNFRRVCEGATTDEWTQKVTGGLCHI